MTRREAAMIIEAIPDKIWSQMQDAEREAILMGAGVLVDEATSIDNIIKKLDDRIFEFIKKHPEKKNGAEVESIRELIHTIELEVENER